MSEVLKLFENLSQYFHPHIQWESVEEIYANSSDDHDFLEDSLDYMSDSGTDSDDSDNVPLIKTVKIKSIRDIPMVKSAVKDPQVISLLQEISTTIRSLRESDTGYDNTYDCWDRVIEVSPRDKYLAFVYALLGLAKYNPTSKTYRKLSMATASAYFLSLTIPGSKGFHIFDDKMINQALEIFRLADTLQDEDVIMTKQERVEIWVNFSNLCDDLKLMFRYVHFDEYKEVRNSILWALNKLLYNNHLNGYENIYSANFHSKCFEVYDEVANPHNGDPEETLTKIMRMSYCLHIFPPAPRRKEAFVTGASTQLCEHVSEWFVRTISKYPRIVSKVLKFYIECIVTNPEKDWRNEQVQRALEYAAKYDAALYTTCNESIVPFLVDATNADDVQIRTNATELLARIILLESKVNWEMFRHEISEIPREVHIIRELMIRITDVNNSIKLKALHAFCQAYQRGTPDAIKIIKECIQFAPYNDENIELPEEPRSRLKELRYKRPEAPQPAYSFKGYKNIEPIFSKLPKTLYYLFRNTSVHVRKAAIALVEAVVLTNPVVIYQTNFVKECSRLGDDPTALVRKQALQVVDSILGKYLNCYPVIYTWCRVIVPLFKDNDQKIVDAAWECFKRRVFDNINGIDKSNKPEHFMPWVILRVLLTTQSRHLLQSCINTAISKNFINEKVVTLIESHTLTANSTEAWTLLSFIAGKVKSKEPDTLISSFIKSLMEQSWNVVHNLQIILEVLAICIDDFSHTALNMAFINILNLMKSGTIPPNIISKAFNFCMTISYQSERKKEHKRKGSGTVTQEDDKRIRDKNQLKWVTDIHGVVEKYLIENLKDFYSSRKVIMSFLFTYTEANSELPVRPHNTITSFVHKFLEEYIKVPESDHEPEDINTVNQMIILAARFSIRDPSIAHLTCVLFKYILRKTERPATVNNVIVCVSDLCKRHTQIVEMNISEILHKLKSPCLEIRLVTFKSLALLVMQDLLKLRGNLLISLMTTLLDRSPELSNRATEFFLTYLESKNQHLFQTCLLECPFVFNEYMHFEGFDSFSGLESKFDSPLKGEEKSKSRQMLYRVFILEQNEIFLLMYFDNLKLIFGKMKSDKKIKCNEGYDMIKDILYIMKRICIVGIEKKDSKQQSQEAERAQDDAANVDQPQPGTSTECDAVGKRKRRNNAPTMSQALSVVEKSICLLPKIADIALEWDNSFQKPIDDLSVAICRRFESITEFAQPAIFWEKHIRAAKQHSSPTRKRKSERTFVDSDDDETLKVIEEPSAKNKMSDDASVSILFQPLFVGV